jgi:hypothetical protein
MADYTGVNISKPNYKADCTADSTAEYRMHKADNNDNFTTSYMADYTASCTAIKRLIGGCLHVCES